MEYFIIGGSYIIVGFIIFGYICANDDEISIGYIVAVVLLWPMIVAMMIGAWIRSKLDKYE